MSNEAYLSLAKRVVVMGPFPGFEPPVL